jgi:predicted  nucleic acid-binding Zn-ribbon protein
MKDALQLARLAACDAELYRKRQQRAEIVERLEEKRARIAAVKSRGGRGRGRPVPPLAIQPGVREEDRQRYAALLEDFEADVQRSAPLLVKLSEEAHEIERRRSSCLSALSERIRAAYEARLVMGRLPAVACVEGRSCGGCGQDLDADLSDRREARTPILICSACHRLLYSSPVGDGAER